MIVNNKMKGLLKGLRYISQIFDEEEEKELQIGYPTDVKHVAHIGCEGTSANGLTWLGQYQSTSERDDANGNCPQTPTKEISKLQIDSRHSSSINQLPNSPAKRRHRRRSSASESSLETDRMSNREKDLSKGGNRQSRRHHSDGSTSESLGNDQPSNENFRRSRRHSKPSSTVSESSVRDVPPIPKQSRRRKSKEESNSTAPIAAGGIP